MCSQSSVRSHLESLDDFSLIVNYVDLKDRDLLTIEVVNEEPPGLSSTAFDVAFWLERIRGYCWWASYLNEVRKQHGRSIQKSLAEGTTQDAAFKSGLQEVGYHFIALSCDAAAKRFRLIMDRTGAQVPENLLLGIGRYGTLRNDFEHPSDERHLEGKYGSQIFEVEKQMNGDITSFGWGYGASDNVATRKDDAPMSDEGIQEFMSNLTRGLAYIRTHCLESCMSWVDGGVDGELLDWMLMRRVVTTAIDPSQDNIWQPNTHDQESADPDHPGPETCESELKS